MKKLETITKKIMSLRTPDKPFLRAYHLTYLSTKEKIEKILEISSPSQHIFFIGDDDLISLALYFLGYKNLWVIDIDEELLEILSKNSTNKIVVLKYDLKKIYERRWPKINQKFDLFITDPPYTYDGMKIFSSLGIKHLKIKGRGMITYPEKAPPRSSIKDIASRVSALQEFVARNGCKIEEIIKDSQISFHGTVGSIMIIRKIKKVSHIKFGKLTGIFY